MAGYFTKNNGYVYNGENLCNVAAGVKNGQFVDIGAGGVVLAVTGAGYTFRIVEKTDINGETAVRADVVAIGAGETFMVEGVNYLADRSSDEFVIKKGELVRMRRPQTGDQIIVTVPAAVYSAVAVGDTLIVEANTGNLRKSA